ncbi:LAFE_0F01068g1_1 [Lachancea fermentati]|uniref:LAFE_0F01068g1_1 n=1 Tax=Lachancea fermentati TaxID=4955 RepID=A0A1G4MEG0_LACFM|nr:LAFE_0F01068g1_1 [Lachancea fermentati]
MFTPIYSSPFPVLNPRVRYKTALERAGFDVAYNGPEPGAHPSGTRSPSGGQHSTGASVRAYRYESSTSLPNSRYGNGSGHAPVVAQSAQASASVTNAKSAQGSPYVAGAGNPPVIQPAETRMYKSLSNLNRESSMFDFENHASPARNTHGSGAHKSENQEIARFPAESEPLNPVEQSFMQLTQSSGVRNSMQSAQTTSANDTSDEDLNASVPSSPRNELNDTIDTNSYSSHNAQLTPAQRDSVCSVSFTPVAELNVSLSPSRKRESALVREPRRRSSFYTQNAFQSVSIPVINVSEAHSNVTDSDESENSDTSVQSGPDRSYTSFTSVSNTNHESTYSFQASVKDRPSYETEQLDDDSKDNDDIDSQSDPTQNGTLVSSLQVERLIAQLDDVSFNRSLSVKKNRPLGPNQTHVKKSSAYLSGYIPPLNVPSSGIESLFDNDDKREDETTLQQQVLTVEEKSVPSTDISPPSLSTPQFYHFKTSTPSPFEQDSPEQEFDNMTRPSEHLTALVDTSVVQPMQLSKKKSINNLQNRPTRQEDKTPLIPPDRESRLIQSDELFRPSSEQQDHPTVFKFPPGQGPCRTCGLEVTTKRVYSKNENELSGQWHRPCFKCIVCDLQFSKKVPCYILDDEPYCQQHYHETNNSICGICNGFIEGECLENDRSERFHVDCLRCFRCQSPIREDYFLFNELPLCANHDIEALLAEGIDEADSVGRSNTVSKRRTRIINFI